MNEGMRDWLRPLPSHYQDHERENGHQGPLPIKSSFARCYGYHIVPVILSPCYLWPLRVPLRLPTDGHIRGVWPGLGVRAHPLLSSSSFTPYVPQITDHIHSTRCKQVCWPHSMFRRSSLCRPFQNQATAAECCRHTCGSRSPGPRTARIGSPRSLNSGVVLTAALGRLGMRELGFRG